MNVIFQRVLALVASVLMVGGAVALRAEHHQGHTPTHVEREQSARGGQRQSARGPVVYVGPHPVCQAEQGGEIIEYPTGMARRAGWPVVPCPTVGGAR